MSDTLKHALSHVYWIGGSPCCGKSSIVRWLMERHDLHSYNCDDAFRQHGQEVTATEQPTFYRILHMSWDEIWMREPRTMVQDVLDIYAEEFPMIVRDLLALPTDRPIIAEGAALMPDPLHPVLANPRKAIWVVPSEGFQREQYPKRGEWVHEILAQCSEPKQAFQNWMNRDVAFARHIETRSRILGLRTLCVDGEKTITDNAETVQDWFFGTEKGG